MPTQTKGIIYSAITAVCWGLLAIALKVAVMEFDPVTLVWMRFFIAFLILLGWQLFRNPGSLKILITPPFFLIIAAFALAWNYYGFMWGVFYTTPSNAQLFIQFGPVLLAISGLLVFKERFSRIQAIGFVVALAGFAFFYADQLTAFFDGKNKYNLGVIFTLSGATAWTLYAILQKKLIQKYSSSVLNLFLFGFPSCFSPVH